MATHYHIYGNGGTGGPVDYSSPIATVTIGTSWDTPPLAPGDWRFGVRAFDSVSGLEETNVDARTAIVIDSGGADVTLKPRPPILLSARAIASGYIRLNWAYPIAAKGMPWRPTAFNVYAGVAGPPNYASVLATIVYNGLSTYQATIGPYSHGNVVTAAVRALNAIGEEKNTITVTATAAVAGPSAVESLTGAATSKTRED